MYYIGIIKKMKYFENDAFPKISIYIGNVLCV